MMGASILLGVAILFGVLVLVGLLAIGVTKFVEKERKRERKSPAHISGLRRMYGAKQGGKTEKENRNFFHWAHGFVGSVAQARQKGKPRQLNDA